MKQEILTFLIVNLLKAKMPPLGGIFKQLTYLSITLRRFSTSAVLSSLKNEL